MATRQTKSRNVEVLPPFDEDERQAQATIGRQMMQYPDPEPMIPEIPEDDPDDVALANVIADLGGPGIDAKVNVYQLDTNRNKAFVRSYLPAEFSLENVQSEYGPGDYEIHVRKDGKLATRKVLKIATPKSAPLAPNQNNALETARIVETMQNGFKDMGTMFATALAGLANNQPKAKSTMEMLQEMQLMREIMGGNQPAAPTADPMQMMEIAMNLAEKIQPRQGEPGTGEVIMEAIKNFAPLLSQAAQRQQAAPVMVPQLAHDPTAPQVPQGVTEQVHFTPAYPQPALTEQETDEMNLARKMYLNLLVSNAKADNDPSTYANLMLDLAGEQAALEFANDPQWFEKLCAEEPRAAEFRTWFDELRVTVLELTKPELPDITDGDKANNGPTPAPDNVL